MKQNPLRAKDLVDALIEDGNAVLTVMLPNGNIVRLSSYEHSQDMRGGNTIILKAREHSPK